VARILILRATLAALVVCAPMRAWGAATVLDYVGSDGSFNVVSDLRVTSRGSFYMLCLDMGADKIWTWNARTGKWNDDVIGNQNPVGGVGGQTLGGLAAGSYFPAVALYTNAINMKANFGATSFPSTPGIPSGYSSWNAIAGATTWNPSDKAANITLSEGDLLATSASTAWKVVRGTTSSALSGSDKICYSTLNPVSGASGEFTIGVANSTASLSNFVGNDNNGISCYGYPGFTNYYVSGTTSNPCAPTATDYKRNIRTVATVSGKKCIEFTLNSFYSGGFQPSLQIGLVNASEVINGKYVGETTNSVGVDISITGRAYFNDIAQDTAGAYVAGTTNMACVDTTAKLFWHYNYTTGLWNGVVIGSSNPATGTGGVDISTMGGTWSWAIGLIDITGNTDITVNFGATAFTNTIPSGFNTQDSGGPSFRTQIVQ